MRPAPTARHPPVEQEEGSSEAGRLQGKQRHEGGLLLRGVRAGRAGLGRARGGHADQRLPGVRVREEGEGQGRRRRRGDQVRHPLRVRLRGAGGGGRRGHRGGGRGLPGAVSGHHRSDYVGRRAFYIAETRSRA